MAGKSSNKSGVSAQTLSLPKGGGAIHGMGEKFQPDLHTGNGNSSIPLHLPPGRRPELTPQTVLSSTTGAGNGSCGLGWSLVGNQCVSLKYSKGNPVYDDDQDTFILSGAEDLVEVERVSSGTGLTTYYRPRTEGLFAKIAHVVDDGENYWEITSKDGIRSVYGDTTSCRIFISENGTDHIFAWYLTKTEDRLGNKILYHYKRDDGPTPPEPNHTYNQIYLEQIEYCNYRDPSTNTEKYLFQIDFDYGEFDASEQRTQEWKLRLDPFSSYRAGFEIRTARRCERILIRSLDPGANAPTHLIRSYDLNYLQDPLTGVSLLQSVVHRCYSTQPPGAHLRDWDFELQTDIAAHPHRNTNLYVVAFPPVTFGYTSFAPERRTVQTLSFGCDHPPEHSLADPDYELIDMYGNGLPDILHTTDTGYFCWRNLGRGRFSGPRRLQSAPAGVTLRDEGVQFADMQGNGSADLLFTDGSARGFYENDFSGDWGRFHPYSQAPSFSLKDPNVRLVDLDGDGVIDVLATFEHHFLYIQNCSWDGRLEFADPVPIPRQHDLDAWPDVFFSNAENRVHLADMSGDGLQDIVLIHQGRIDYWPNLGYGRWGRRVTLLNGPRLQWRYDPKRLFLADINGDGLADLIYVDSCSVRYWINQSGNSWSDEQVISCAPQVTNFDSVRIADVNGTGTPGILWSFDWSPTRHGNYLYLDFTGGEKPMLLNRIDNHMGALTHVEYRPSTDFYVADQDAGRPWKTSLPFPVNVVSKVTTEDLITGNKLVSIKSYAEGFHDGRDGEYRGFGRVDQQDAEAVDGGQYEMPPVLTKTWFHNGAYFEGEQISRQYMEQYYLESDRPEGFSASPDKKFLAMLLEDTVLPPDLSAEEAREACRALNGSILRQETYALDKTDRESRPYSVSERNYTVKLLQSRGENKYAVFFTHPRETINFHYERSLYKVSGDSLVDPATPPPSAANAADPRVTHSMNLAVDDFGNVLQSVSVAYGRRFKDPSLTQADQEKQRQTLITYSDNRVTNAILEPGAYRAPLPCESRTFEVVKVAPPAGPQDITNLFRFDELLALVGTQAFQDGTWDIPYHDTNYTQAVDNHPYRRLIEHDRILYRKDDLTGSLQLGAIESLALPFESYRLAFTPELASQTYVNSGKLSLTELETVLTDEGRYVKDGNGWWIPSGRVFYSPNKSDAAVKELDYAQAHYFQPRRFRDPFEETTTVSYDSYDLMVQETRDPLDNVVTAGMRDENGNLVLQGNDYRVLQPRLLMDPNRNRSAVDFDALGMVCATAVMGKPGEQVGDSLDGFDPQLFDAAVAGCWQDPLGNPHGLLQGATTRLVYDLFAYWRTRGDQQPQPPRVYTLVRETHEADLDAGQKTKIQHSFSYSDGFGREIQKKVQAEPEMINGVAGPPRWVGSGWTIFNNKGKPVRKYEPFFSPAHLFDYARTEGVSSVLFYDPVGRVVATLHPNHTYEKVVFDPWKQANWDVNDTVLQADPRSDPDVGRFFKALPDAEYLPSWHDLRTDQANAAALAAKYPDSTDLTNEKRAAEKTRFHAATPTAVHTDSLGRTFLTVAHNRFKYSDALLADPPTEEFYRACITFDIEGNQREVIDATDRVVMRYDYDMLGNRIHQASMEAGQRWMLSDVAGKPLYAWDSRDHRFSTEYDPLRRPLRTFVTGADPSDLGKKLLTERLVYGEAHPDSLPDGAGNPAGLGLNLRGKAFLLFDQAGSVRNEGYDFKGNPLSVARQLARESKRALDWSPLESVSGMASQAGPAVPLDLSTLGIQLSASLEAETYASRTGYDALNRPIQLIAPHSDQARATVNVIQPIYNEANLLEQVHAWLNQGAEPAGQLDPATADLHAVADINYDAKGQRTLIDFGTQDGKVIRTTYTYDRETFRLTHLYTRRGVDPSTGLGQSFTDDCDNPQPPPHTMVAPAKPPQGMACGLQNLHYTYDPAGNITSISDDAQQTIYFKNKCVKPSSDYAYDAVYRLIEATGREHVGQVGGKPIPHSYNDVPRVGLLHPNGGNLMGKYCETYVYDEVGNIQEMSHRRSCPDVPSWTRVYEYNEPSLLEPGKENNRLSSTQVGNGPTATPELYVYDAHGNMLRMPHLQVMQWDFRDQLQMTQRQKVNDDDTDGGLRHGERTWYVYDGTGQRVRKVTELANNGGLKDESVYLGGFEIHRQHSGNSAGLVRESLHIVDDKQRIALVETRTQGTDPGPQQIVRYQLGNHLGSACLELDDQAQIISYEEYTPYGSSSYQAVRSETETPKQYRYTGKERDQETGFGYHGARYFAPWLGRWSSCDPIGLQGGLNLYVYTADNPICRIDLGGKDDADVTSPGIDLSKSGDIVARLKKIGSGTQGRQAARRILMKHARFGGAGAPGNTELGAWMSPAGKVYVAAGFETWIPRLQQLGYRLLGHTHPPQGGRAGPWFPSRADLMNIGQGESEIFTAEGVGTYGKSASGEIAIMFQQEGRFPIYHVFQNEFEYADWVDRQGYDYWKSVGPGQAAKTSLVGRRGFSTTVPSAEASPQASRLTRVAGQSSRLRRAADWTRGAVAQTGRAAAWLARAASLVLGVAGAVNEANRVAELERRNNRGLLNENLMWYATAAVVGTFSLMDDALAGVSTMAMGFPEPVMRSWEQHGAGPFQHLAGEALRNFLHWAAQHGL